MRAIQWTVLLAVWVLGVAHAAEKLPYERLLRGEDQKQAAALEKQIGDLWAAAKFTEATVPAEKLLNLRRRVQGPNHWQAADGARELETLRQAARLPDEQQRQLAHVSGFTAKGTDLYQHGKYAEVHGPITVRLCSTSRILVDQSVGRGANLRPLSSAPCMQRMPVGENFNGLNSVSPRAQPPHRCKPQLAPGSRSSGSKRQLCGDRLL